MVQALGRRRLAARNGSSSYAHQTTGIPRRDHYDPSFMAGFDSHVASRCVSALLADYEAWLFSCTAYKTLQAPVVERRLLMDTRSRFKFSYYF